MGINVMSKELCLLIVEDLPIPDLFNFLRKCRGLSHLLAPQLLELGLQGRGELTALQWAAKRSYESLVDTPLHLPVEGNLEEVVKLLLENGSDTEIINREGKTPLQLAHRRGDKRVVKALIDAGINLNLNLGGIATANT